MTEELQQSTVFDSDRQHLGDVYAKALLGAAAKSNETAAVLEQLDSVVQDVLTRLPKVAAALSSPRVPHEAKEQMLDKAFGGKMSPTLLNFLKVLSRRGRLDCLAAISAAARRQYNEATGRIQVTVRTAEGISDEQRDAIAARLQQALGGEGDMQTSVDPSLIGGIVVRVGDQVFDGSIARRLVRLRDGAVERISGQIRESLDRFALAD